MSETQPSPSQPLTVTLTFAEWRMVLQQLAEGPFKVVMPLIAAVEKQCSEDLERSKHPPNGAGNAHAIHAQPGA